MAEAIGLASAIAGLLTLIGEVTKLSYDFFSDVRRASRDQKRYLQEVSALTEVLLRVERAFELGDLVAGRSSTLGLANAVQDCEGLLVELKTSLSGAGHEGAGRLEKVKAVMRWPFEEKEVKKLVETLARYRGVFVAVLSADTFAVSVATYQKVDDLSQGKRYREILDWLGNPKLPLSVNSLLDSACPNTGQWLLNHPEYLKWRDEATPLLWCHGIPGVGKTVITSIIIDDLRHLDKSSNSSVIYHFCDFSERKTETTKAALLGLLKQLLLEHDAEIISLLALRRENSEKPSLKELSQTLLDVTRLRHRTYLVIDALDEFEDRKVLIPILRGLARNGTKVLATSRDIPDIRDAFQAYTDLEIKASRSDLEGFVDERLQESEFYESLNGHESIVPAVVDQAGGMFLLAQLLVKHLLSLTNLKQMKNALKSMPSNLEEAYKSSFNRILGQSSSRADFAMRVIGWITHAERRFKAKELQYALAVEEETEEVDEENITPLKIILQVCVGLVSVNANDGTIGMIHATAYEYFRDLKKTKPLEIQLDMAETSMRYLLFRPLRNGLCDNLDSLQERFEALPFLGYAAEHWGHHASYVEKQLANKILELLQDHHARENCFQALQYREIKDPKLAVATFDSLPKKLEPLHVAAFWNLTETAQTLLTSGGDPDIVDGQEWTPLHWACSRGNEKIMNLLLQHKANIDNVDLSGWTPLFWATIKGYENIVARLLDHNAQHLLTDVNGWTVLHWAASKGDTDIIKILLDHHSKFKARSNPVTIATKDVTVQHAKQMLSRQHQPKKESKIPLEIAAERCDTQTFDTLLQDLATMGPKTNFNELWAQRGFDEPRVRIPWRVMTKSDRFDSHGLERWNINSKSVSSDKWKSKLLHGAIRDGKVLIVKLLIELGVDANDRIRGRSPLKQAASLAEPEIAEILLANGANPDSDYATNNGFPPLHFAVALGFDRTAKAFLHGGVDVNGKSSNGTTPLMMACQVTSDDDSDCDLAVRMVKMLIDHGADVHIKNSRDGTALHVAAEYLPSGSQVIKILLENGVDANVADRHGHTPLHVLSGSRGSRRTKRNRTCRPEVREAFDLLLAYAQPGAESLECPSMHGNKDDDGMDTPMSLAIESGNWEVFYLLKEKGARFRTSITPSQLLLDVLDRFDVEPQVVEMLLAEGADPTIGPSSGAFTNKLTSVHRALRWLLHRETLFEDFKSVMKMLIDAGVDVNGVDYNNQTLLHVAVDRCQEPRLIGLSQYLIDVGVDVFRPFHGIWDAFLLAAVSGKLETLQNLLSHASKNPNPQHWINLERKPDADDPLEIISRSLAAEKLLSSEDPSGFTPLGKAVDAGNTSFVFKLLSHGADLHAADKYGWTILHQAIHGLNEGMVELLLRAGSQVNRATTKWQHQHNRPSGLYNGDEWAGTPLHLAAMMGKPGIVRLLLQYGADVHADTGTQKTEPYWCRGHGPSTLNIALDTGTFYGSRAVLGPGMLKVAEMLVERGIDVRGAADHIGLHEVANFEGFEELWEKLRAGITEA